MKEQVNSSEEIHVEPALTAMSTVDYNSGGATVLESEAEKFGSSDRVDAGAAVPVEQGGLTQYELANDPHR